MSQNNIQTENQQQKLEQGQSLSAQQVLTVRLTEMSVEALRQRVENECQENPWLEKAENDFDADDDLVFQHSDGEGENDYKREDDYSTEDDIPDYLIRATEGRNRPENIEWGETQTFYDKLKEQAGEYDLDERLRPIMDYLIGSLENSGLITKPLFQIVDELEIYQGITTTEEELESLLRVMWQFDPPGIGARSIQECLLIQIARKKDTPNRKLMEKIIGQYYDDFIKNRWDRIQQRLHLSDVHLSMVQRELLRLNPRPGTALGESSTQGEHHITPDFIVDTDTEGNVIMTLNEGDIPNLLVSAEALDKVKTYEAMGANLSRTAQEDLQFTRNYVYRGQMFINAIVQRRNSMVRTMQAIIKLQHDFFLEGDESSLIPMRLEDVAELSGVDISTVSRVCNNKYVQTVYGTVPMRWFFSSSANRDGDEVSVRKVKAVLKEIIQSEDTKEPFTDDRLTAMMQEKGYAIARRTVAKYREQLGYPAARLRKERT